MGEDLPNTDTTVAADRICDGLIITAAVGMPMPIAVPTIAASPITVMFRQFTMAQPTMAGPTIPGRRRWPTAGAGARLRGTVITDIISRLLLAIRTRPCG